MRIYSYEEAFGGADKTSAAMRKAIEKWKTLYYERDVTEQSDPCQRIAYTVVNKLVKTMFGEYSVKTEDAAAQQILSQLDKRRKEAVQLALVEGECYIKPCVDDKGITFVNIPRSNMLVFARNADGEPTDIGTAERSTRGKYYYTLLERRTLDENGYLTITNRLFRASNAQNLGVQVSLKEHPAYEMLPDTYCFEKPLHGIGLVRMRTPMLNCVDGSADAVAVYAAAVDLIENIDRNEAQMNGEFRRGQSRVIASADMLKRDANGVRGLSDDLFVGLDEDPEMVGITIFSPPLREQSFLARKQEYLRNVESVIGLRRGMLSDANVEDRTATEITSSSGDFNLTVIDFQQMWQETAEKTLALCTMLSSLYALPEIKDARMSIDWGNGVLYDEEKKWSEYQQMVDKGLLKPEIALGWRFNLSAQTESDRELIRKNWMPASE